MFLVAVLVAGLTRLWDDVRARQARRAAVAVFVSIPGDGYVSGGRTGDVYTYDSGIHVINAGPLPITLGRITATSARISVQGDAGDTLVPVGTAQAVDVHLAIDCRYWSRNQNPVDLRVGVRTADGAQRTVTTELAVEGTFWEQMAPAC